MIIVPDVKAGDKFNDAPNQIDKNMTHAGNVEQFDKREQIVCTLYCPVLMLPYTARECLCLVLRTLISITILVRVRSVDQKGQHSNYEKTTR